uniref:Uncharacterized protein n=3 Tax=Aegilops tauschii subsp. strangulata TaxID=200361 RepID=A0A452YE80_AEGTS
KMRRKKKKSRRKNTRHHEETGNDTEVDDPESDGRSVHSELADLDKEEASGEAGIVSASTGDDTWLSIAREMRINKLKPNVFSGGIVMQYSIQNIEEAPVEGKLYQGSFCFQHDIDGSTSTECSFLIAENLNHAKEIYKSSVAVSHEGIAKAYFFTYCIPLKKHVVVYEPLEYYKMETMDSICFNIKSLKFKWLDNIRNIFGSLESLHTMRLSHPCTVDIHSYMWSKRDSSKYSTRLVGAHGKIGKDGRVDDSGSTERNERRGVLSFLELLKITGCEDYPSLKELVEQRNLIEHKRDELLYSHTHINFRKMVSELSSTFPTFFGWLYTYLNLVS